MSICFFIGHRDSPASLYPALRDAVMRHADEYGVTEFLVGHYGAFDRLAAAAVIAAKTDHPHVKLTLLLPYHPSVQPIEVPRGFDGTCYPSGMESVPPRHAIVCANRYAAARADHLIAYVRHAASNARDVVDYAKRRGVAVCNLAETNDPS